MKKSRRKFISSLIGSIAVGGLAGCMESKNNQSNDNRTNNNANNDDVENEDQVDDENQVDRDLSPYVESFTYEFNCQEDKKQVKNIGQSDANEYTFSGITNVDSDCYDVSVNADVINNRLNVQIQLTENDEINCKNCESQLSYTGIVRTNNDQKVDISEVNIVYN